MWNKKRKVRSKLVYEEFVERHPKIFKKKQWKLIVKYRISSKVFE